MAKKFVCPVCGSEIQYWKEYLVTKTQNINSETGRLNNAVKISKPDANNGDMQGFQCLNIECGWCINVVNQSIPDELNEWYDNFKNDINV